MSGDLTEPLCLLEFGYLVQVIDAVFGKMEGPFEAFVTAKQVGSWAKASCRSSELPLRRGNRLVRCHFAHSRFR